VGAASSVLMDLGPDSLRVNDELVRFAKLLDVECKKAEAGATEPQGAAQAATARLASLRELLKTTLTRLSQRKQLSLGHMVFIGQAMNALAMTDEAGREFHKILDRTETDAEFAQSARQAMSLIRSELLKALRKQGKYEEALRQVDQLIKDNPKALEPLLEKGRILEALAESDAGKLPTCVDHWVMVRNRLQGLSKKPDEYYEVTYRIAWCLIRQSEISEDKAAATERASEAEKVLKAALILQPKLSGPHMVARYQSLLKKAIALQGRQP
jgi:tetratricopeptide (TPR) repeat protein